MLAQGASAVPAFLIADAVSLRKYGLGMVRPGGWGTRAAIADRPMARTVIAIRTSNNEKPASLLLLLNIDVSIV